VCGGPAPYDFNPDQECLAPGIALCEICSDSVPEWEFNQYNVSFCDGQKPRGWLTLSGKIDDDLTTACHAAKYVEDHTNHCNFPGVDAPIAAHKSCLYNLVMTSLGIYNSTLGGWPLPTKYPDDPL
jgi:hypothetical protein